ncbi:MAG: hypothetical protein Q4A00_08265 [Flavobacteriaceae bacterium]|nr:hypothetical protein [Flavobacteriaceae bacterium]
MIASVVGLISHNNFSISGQTTSITLFDNKYEIFQALSSAFAQIYFQFFVLSEIVKPRFDSKFSEKLSESSQILSSLKEYLYDVSSEFKSSTFILKSIQELSSKVIFGAKVSTIILGLGLYQSTNQVIGLSKISKNTKLENENSQLSQSCTI